MVRGIEIAHAILADEPSDRGVVVAGLKVVIPRLLLEAIAPISVGIDVLEDTRRPDLVAVGIIDVARHLVAVGIIEPVHIPLKAQAVEVFGAVIVHG